MTTTGALLLAGCGHDPARTTADAPGSIAGPDAPVPQPGDAFTFTAIPDPQYLTEDDPKAYHPIDAPFVTLRPLWRSMTGWISDHAADPAWNIKLTIPLGDMVDDGFSTREWANAADMYAQLQDATGEKVQFAPLAGNHDADTVKEDGTCDVVDNCGKTDHDLTNMNAAFPLARIASQSSHDAAYPYFYSSYPFGTVSNVAMSLRAGGVNWLVIQLAWFDEGWGSPQAWDDGALAWANQLIADAPEKQVIIATHSCLTPLDQTGPAPHPGGLNGEKTHLWNSLAKKHPNVSMVVCGHVGGTSARTEFKGDAGNPVMFMLSDFQTHAEAAPNTYVRRMRFDPAAGTVAVSTYSEFNGNSLTDADNEFVLEKFPFLLQPDNAARGATVTTSSSHESTANDNWRATNLVDGHRGFGTAKRIGWSSDPHPAADLAAPEWVEVDLGAETWVSKAYLFPRSDSAACHGGGLPVDYTIETSLDDVTWEPAATITGATPPPFAAPIAQAFTARPARFVRLSATKLAAACPGSDDSFRLQLAELEIY